MLTLVKIWLKIKHAAYCKDEQHTTLSLFAFGFFITSVYEKGDEANREASLSFRQI